MSNNELQNEVTDKYSLRGRVFHRIREDILAGKFKQNEELKETAIAGDLGVSRTPVREALRQLELEGLVNIIPNKGAYVTGITAKDIKDIYSIRSLLRGLMCQMGNRAYYKGTDGRAGRNLLPFGVSCSKKKHYEQVLELDNKFHEILYQASNSKQLQHMLSDFHHYVQRVRKITLSSDARIVNTNEEHKKIVEALKEKNPDKAEFLANEHIMNTIKNISDCGLENILKQADE